MTYHLFCVVNAAGVPYDSTFAPTEEGAIFRRAWSFPTETPPFVASIPQEKLDAAWVAAQERGDRCVAVVVETQETVTVEAKP